MNLTIKENRTRVLEMAKEWSMEDKEKLNLTDIDLEEMSLFRFFTVNVDDIEVGCAAMRYCPISKAAQLPIFIKPEHRRKGIGLALRSEMEQIAKKKGAILIYALVKKGNKIIHKLLTKLGYEYFPSELVCEDGMLLRGKVF